MRRALLVLAVAGLLAGCSSSDSNDESSPSTTTSSSASLPQYHFAAFSSPTGNIGCYSAQNETRCDVGEQNWPNLPPKPSDCDLDWGGALAVDTTGAGFHVCRGDTTLGPPDVIPYGEANEVGDFICRSERSGMECTNTTTKHGFQISRTSFRLF